MLYRMLYFTVPGHRSVILHGLTKAQKIPHGDIEVAEQRMRDYLVRWHAVKKGESERLGKTRKEIKRELLQNPEFRKAYKNLEPEFQVARSIIALRTAKGITQTEMARRASIQRPMLSRLESAKEYPTIPTLARLAAALRVKIEVRFVDRHNKDLKRTPAIRMGGSASAMHAKHR